MCSKFLSGKVSELVGYTYPKLHKGKEWYVDFYARDPATNKMRRKKSYSQKLGLFAKPDNCLIDKVE